MERMEVPVRADMADWIAAVDRGAEVVLVRDGEPVATVSPVPRRGSLDLRALARVQDALAPLRTTEGGAELIRRLRDESEH